MPLKERASVPGLSPDRADIIVAGLAIVDRVMDRFEVNSVQVHNRGVRDGLVLSMVEQSLGTGNEKPRDRNAALERLAASCGCEMDHSRHVAKLAGQIFAQLAPHCHLHAEDQPLLEAAAKLQDVGYLINYDQHHKHSYHLILHSRLEGFQPNELEIIANVARYHRGAAPKRKHANFRQLSLRDQNRVRQMAAILRVAGGLDRSNTQQVTDVIVEFGRRHNISLKLISEQFPEVDIWGAASGVSSSRRCLTPGCRSNGTSRAAAKRRPTQAATAVRRSRPPRHHEKSARARAGAHVGPGPKESSGATALSPHRGRSRFSSTKKRVASARRLVEPCAAG